MDVGASFTGFQIKQQIDIADITGRAESAFCAETWALGFGAFYGQFPFSCEFNRSCKWTFLGGRNTGEDSTFLISIKQPKVISIHTNAPFSYGNGFLVWSHYFCHVSDAIPDGFRSFWPSGGAVLQDLKLSGSVLRDFDAVHDGCQFSYSKNLPYFPF